MNNIPKKGFLNLSARVLAVVSTVLAMLGQKESQAMPRLENHDEGRSPDYSSEMVPKKKNKPKLVLKPNFINPERSLLARHGSHSSHSSHSSHTSHYSSSGGSDGDGVGGIVVGALVLGGVIYAASRSHGKGPDKK